MKGVYSYYVTYMLLDNGIYKTDAGFGFMSSVFGTEINFGELIKGINISFSEFRLEHVFGIHTYDNGTYQISVDLIKDEVCNTLWDIMKLNYRDVKGEELEKIKNRIIEQLLKNIIILGWSETNLK